MCPTFSTSLTSSRYAFLSWCWSVIPICLPSAQSQYNGNENDHDPNRGFVNYKNRKEAFDRELVKYGGNEVYIGVDHQNKWWSPDGRPSVRLESKKDYTKGLFIARFNHLPKRVCGVWPAL